MRTAERVADRHLSAEEADDRLSEEGLGDLGYDVSVCPVTLLATRYAVGLWVMTGGYAVANELVDGVCFEAAAAEDEDLLRSPPDPQRPTEASEDDGQTWSDRRVLDEVAHRYEEEFEEGFRRAVLVSSLEPGVQAKVYRRSREAMEVEGQHQTRLVRDIFMSPLRPVTFLPEWRTSNVVSLAQQMYDEREFGAMPILADALQDAGCADKNILSHCRGPGPHVRGCWVVDLILGKE